MITKIKKHYTEMSGIQNVCMYILYTYYVYKNECFFGCLSSMTIYLKTKRQFSIKVVLIDSLIFGGGI